MRYGGGYNLLLHQVRLPWVTLERLMTTLGSFAIGMSREAAGEYSAINNNCGTPLQNCMREIGKGLQPVNMILPESINPLLWWMSDDSTIQRGKR